MDTNFPPVGDIQIKKSSGTFNTYKLELSYGQIVAIKQALEAKHDDPIADDLLAMFDYYMRELPGPGEDENKLKEREAAAEPDDESDTPIPMPPGGAAEDDTGDELPEPPEDETPTENLPELGSSPEGGEDTDRLGGALADLDREHETETTVPEPPTA